MLLSTDFLSPLRPPFLLFSPESSLLLVSSASCVYSHPSLRDLSACSYLFMEIWSHIHSTLSLHLLANLLNQGFLRPICNWNPSLPPPFLPCLVFLITFKTVRLATFNSYRFVFCFSTRTHIPQCFFFFFSHWGIPAPRAVTDMHYTLNKYCWMSDCNMQTTKKLS